MKRIFILILAITATSMTAQNQQQPKPSVDVTGEGFVNVVPDEVTISLRVEHSGKNAREVKQLNDQTVSEVLKYVKRSGVEEKHVQTEYVRLSKNYDYNTKTYNYVANQSMTVKLVDLGKYESLMNGLLETGINRIDGISFSSSNMTTLESEARKKAITNAKLKATEYAGVLDQTIGKAIHISEFQMVNTPGPVFRSSMAMDSEGGQQTLAPGEMKVSARVNVSFELL